MKLPTTTDNGDIILSVWTSDLPALFDSDSPDAIETLVPIIGPTATIILHRVTRRLRKTSMPYVTTIAQLSHACGGGLNPRATLVTNGLDRLVRFGYAQHRAAGRFEIRTQIPPLAQRQLNHLPVELQRELGHQMKA